MPVKSSDVHFACSLCADSFADLDALEIHLALQHFDHKPFQCEKCQVSKVCKKLPTVAALEQHYMEEHTLDIFSCTFHSLADSKKKRLEMLECLKQSILSAFRHPVNVSSTEEDNSQPTTSPDRLSPSPSNARKSVPVKANQKDKDDGDAQSLAFNSVAGSPRAGTKRKYKMKSSGDDKPKKSKKNAVSEASAWKKRASRILPGVISPDASSNDGNRVMADDGSSVQEPKVEQKPKSSLLRTATMVKPAVALRVNFVEPNGEISFPADSKEKVKLFRRRAAATRRVQAKEAASKTEECAASKAPKIEKKDKLKCAECHQEVVNGWMNLRVHASMHLNLCMFECKTCGKQYESYCITAIKLHIKKHHGDDQSLLIDHRQKHKKALEKEKVRLFGKNK